MSINDNPENTPLDCAISFQNWEGVQLLKKQTDLTLKNKSGITLKERVEKFEKEFLESKEQDNAQLAKKLQLCALL